MADGNAPAVPPAVASRVVFLHRAFSTRHVRPTLLETPKVTGVPVSREATAPSICADSTRSQHVTSVSIPPVPVVCL